MNLLQKSDSLFSPMSPLPLVALLALGSAAKGTAHLSASEAEVIVGNEGAVSTSPAVESLLLQGVDATDWSSIRDAHETWLHKVRSGSQGFEATNPGQDWLTRFDGRGFLTKPASNEWSWGLELVSFGHAGAMTHVEAPICAEAQGNRVSYRWDDSLTEWFINDDRGLEHGYTVHERPAGLRDAADEPGLRIDLRVLGKLRPKIHTGGLGISFLDARGEVALTYSGLTVFDAAGRELPAWFEIAKKGDTSFHLFADESGAQYPITVDPLVQQELYVKASNTDAGDSFGSSISHHGNRIAVGAPGEDSVETGVNMSNQADNSVTDSGAVYIFVQDPMTTLWSQEAYVKASNTGASDQFGFSVSLSDEHLVVGAPTEDSNATGVGGSESGNSASDSGAAYIFVRDPMTNAWSQEAYLKASNTEANDQFGLSVALDGERAVVGANLEDSDATGIDGADNNSASDSGAAYVFVRAGTSWSQEAYVKASNTDNGDQFGASVALAGDRMAVGAVDEDSNANDVGGSESDNTAGDSGAAYVFVRAGTVWSQEAYVKASNTGSSDFFGDSISLFGDRLAVGAPGEDGDATGIGGSDNDSASDAGAVYVFERSSTGWLPGTYVKASNTETLDEFGVSVSLFGRQLAVGARGEDSSATGIGGSQIDNTASNAGAAYLFERDAVSGIWTQQSYVKASNTEAADRFGLSVALYGGRLVVGANEEDSNATGLNGVQTDNTRLESGAAYTFVCPVPLTFTSYCFGDGGDQMGCTDCPCSNNALIGSGGGCLHSGGTGSQLIASGSPSVSLPVASTADLRFSIANGAATQLYILNSGDTLEPTNPANPCFGLGSGVGGLAFDGLRCVSTNTLRNGSRTSDVNGDVGVTNAPWGGEGNPTGGIAQFFGYTAGTTKFFQCIHRDVTTVNCGTGLNTTQAILVDFTP